MSSQSSTICRDNPNALQLLLCLATKTARRNFEDSIMADHTSSSQPALQGMDAHNATYKGFVDFSTAGTLICLYVCVALVAFRFISNPLNLVVGFGGLIVGILASLIALRMGGKWMVSVVPLVLLGLFVAGNAQLS
jgi:Bacterial aa3 type cytochrome c oxidase subunit IV